MIEKKIFTPFHKKTKRKYLERMLDNKIHCMNKARKFEKEYWDGPRRYGYGGYKYIRGLQAPIAKKIINEYNLNNKSKILDAGCGKGFLLYEIKKLLPNIQIYGFDISKYGLKNSKKEVRKYLRFGDVRKRFKFKNNFFDLVISFNCLHNLKIFDLEKSLKEIERVGKKKFIVVESYRNSKELFNLQCWALTANAFFSKKEWVWIFKKFKYLGDYEFIYFE
ncbi:MAG: SAM-dependent methyltransferase [Pelagibacteraceae bacterium TMED65]|nr:MAG: SAM-dependent methyltransferase [Pelagibacteraceae bacterium TMED65]|tara:strand:- start:709 stop:1371 length:663 start_codon:yes stop_codon:yes gene_type:complete